MGKDKCKVGFYYGIQQFSTTILSRNGWQSREYCPLKTALTYIWGIYCLFTVEPILVRVWIGDYMPAGRHEVSSQLSGVAIVTRWYKVQTLKLKFKIKCPWWFLHGSNCILKQEKARLDTKNFKTINFSVKDDGNLLSRNVYLPLHSSWSFPNQKYVRPTCWKRIIFSMKMVFQEVIWNVPILIHIWKAFSDAYVLDLVDAPFCHNFNAKRNTQPHVIHL